MPVNNTTTMVVVPLPGQGLTLAMCPCGSPTFLRRPSPVREVQLLCCAHCGRNFEGEELVGVLEEW